MSELPAHAPTSPTAPVASLAPAACDNDAHSRLDAFLTFWRALPRETGKIAPHVRTFLDNAAPEFQPAVAMVDVVAPQTLTVRLFGTQLESDLGMNVTYANALDFYEPHLREPVFTRALCVVRHPVGWYSERIVTSAKGATMRLMGINLPLVVDSGAPPGMVNFGAVTDRRTGDTPTPHVHAIVAGQWVDIGAGTPSLAPSF